MISLKENLAKIGITSGTPVSYHDSFASRPASLRQAIRSMDAPQNWQPVSDIFRDDFWTDEVQGIGWDGSNWIFSCNANQSKPDANDKAIYVFRGGQPLGDGKWICRIAYKDVPHPIAGLDESDDHWGQLTCYNGSVYVSHYWSGGPKQSQTNVVVFKNSGGILQYENKWIPLEQVTSSDGRTGYPEFQGINPWDGKFYSCLGGENVPEFFIHNPDTGLWEEKRTFHLNGFMPRTVQGACFSTNGHLYVAVDSRSSDWGRDYKWIFYYSALTGTFLGKIPVLAEEDGQELEGICYGAVSFGDGRTAQIHAILLENRDVALDNIFFKSFAADVPEAV
jgi:hypothetical protein